MRLDGGLIWPIPITLDVTPEFADGLSEGQHVALRDQEGVLIATMEVQDVWTPDKRAEANAVFATDNEAHPGVDFLTFGIDAFAFLR